VSPRNPADADPRDAYVTLLTATRSLYADAAGLLAAELNPFEADDLHARLDDLHQGVVLKVYLAVCQADREWCADERRLGEALAEHVWGDPLRGKDLAATMREAVVRIDALRWSTLVGPFLRSASTRDLLATLETLIVRQAHIVARADGPPNDIERGAIHDLAENLRGCLAAADEGREPRTAARSVASPQRRQGEHGASPPPSIPSAPRPPRALAEVLAELDDLVGLDPVKREVRSLANYLALQTKRKHAGLPSTPLATHMVFTGNPGTGKTTVARLVAEAMAALGVLTTGTLVETDRSGLVAEYAGQTGPKTNAMIDRALGGVLFIDEAYSLVSQDGDDSFGREAVQTLLKRAEDDRERLCIILAGYTDEMDAMLATNPGLESRFPRRMHFDDYRPLDLCRIFGRLMDKHHYRITPAGRLRVVATLDALHRAKDEHFGNGRAIRNLFERSILRMADRLADAGDVSAEALVTFEADDIAPPAGARASAPRLRVPCPACDYPSAAGPEALAARVKCPKCGERFLCEWAEFDPPHQTTTERGA
jgi:hypothetical protein